MPTCSLVPPIRPGILAHARGVFPYPLPRGLSEGALVMIEQLEDDHCTVRDHDGHLWSVSIHSLDPGKMIWHNGQWVPEFTKPAAPAPVPEPESTPASPA